MKELHRKGWGGSNYFNVSEVRAFVKEWADKVFDIKRRGWFINTVGSHLLANLGVTYYQKCPLPELPERPAHDLPPDRLAFEMVQWETQVKTTKALRQSTALIDAATQGIPVDIAWAHPLEGRYLAAIVAQLRPIPAWITKCQAEKKVIHAFLPGDDLEAVLAEVVKVLNSPLPEMQRLTYRQFDQMLTFVRNNDLECRVGQISKAEAVTRLKEDPNRLKDLGLRRILEFPCGHSWVQLVPTPEELTGSVVGFTVRGPETRTSYRSLLDETEAMSNGQGVAHFCLGNGVYDAYLEGAGMVLSLRDSDNRPHVTVAIRNDGSIDQLQGRCNSTPKPAYFAHIWAMAERVHLKSSESSGSQARNVGLVGVDNRFVPVTSLKRGARVEGGLSLKGYPFEVRLPEDLTVDGTLDATEVRLTELPSGLTVKGDCILKGCPLTQLPPLLKVTRRLDISATKITHLPPDLEAADLHCNGLPIPEPEVREFLFRASIDTLVKPSFKRTTTGLADVAQVEKAWQRNLLANEASWTAGLPNFKKEFMTKKDGNIGQLVKRVYGKQ